MSITSPVMKPASSLARNTTAAAMSAGSPSRPTGMRPARSAMPATMSVLISAGASAFEVMPSAAYSVAIDLASAMIAAFEAP